MTRRFLLVSSGASPVECRIAIPKLVTRMMEDAEIYGLDLSVRYHGPEQEPFSAIVMIDGEYAQQMASTWSGTILWRHRSTVRQHHKRKNWFLGVFPIDPPAQEAEIDPREISWSALRAGGPGGQHQNTTDSAVRASWRGYSVTCRDQRSQHQNRAQALTRLRELVAIDAREAEADRKRQQFLQHKNLVRGNPTRTFEGPSFREIAVGAKDK